MYGAPVGNTSARTPRSGTWWDEVADSKPRAALQEPGPELEPEPEPEPDERYVFHTQQPAMAYRADVLEERMLLAAVRRRRNELSNESLGTQGQSRQSFKSSASSRCFEPRPPPTRYPSAGDPWSGALTERRAAQQKELVQTRSFSDHHMEWVQKKRETKVPSAYADEELERVHYFVTHARSLVGKPGNKHYFEDMQAQLKSQSSKNRISKDWIKSIERAHADVHFITSLRQREKGRRASWAMHNRKGPMKGAGRKAGLAEMSKLLERQRSDEQEETEEFDKVGLIPTGISDTDPDPSPEPGRSDAS
jgi:hypothetical protein